MKKKLTGAQKARRDERKAKFALLVKRVAAMSAEEKATLAAKIEVMNCEGHTLSLRNQLLIALQIGTKATIVGGFRQWIKQGRCVRKGEHGASILFPRMPKEDPNKREGETSLNGDKVYFLSGTVFDISQTDLLEAEHPVAMVSPEVAEAFGMASLPNVRVVVPQVPAMEGMSILGL